MGDQSNDANIWFQVSLAYIFSVSTQHEDFSYLLALFELIWETFYGEIKSWYIINLLYKKIMIKKYIKRRILKTLIIEKIIYKG